MGNVGSQRRWVQGMGVGPTPYTRRAFLGGSLAAGAGVLLAACGTSESASQTAGGSAKETDLVSNPYGGDLKAEGTPKRGGTVTIGLDREPISFDPAVGYTNDSATAIYDILMKANEDGSIEPYLAESMTPSEDGRVWTLKLRPGVKFHDGTSLDADAVVFNVDRHRGMETSEAYVHAQTINSATATDALTVRFELKEPLGQFPNLLALDYADGSLGVIASPAAIKKYGDDYGRNPVGAGPFEFVKWTSDSVILKRNENYWQKDLPYLNRIVVKWLEDTETRYRSVESGTVDMISGAYHTELIRAMDHQDLETYYGVGFLGAEMLMFNMEKPPFDDRRMREAIVHAINPEAVNATLFQGMMPRATTLFTEGSEYFSKKAADLWPEYSRKRAKELIDSYRSDGGDPNCTFTTTNASNRIQTGQLVQAQCKSVGMDIKLKFYDLSQYASVVVDKRSYQFGTNVIGQDEFPYPTADRFFHSKGGANWTGYSDPQLDKLLEQAARSSDQAERVDLYKRAQVIINRDLPVVWYSRSFLSTITQGYVKGVVRYPGRTLFYATLWRDQ